MNVSSLAIVDDQLLLASALGRSLDQEDGIDIVGLFTTLADVAESPYVQSIDLALISSDFVNDPEFNRLANTTATLVLLKSDIENSLTSALESGATGGVPWTVPYPALVANIRAALRGEVCVPRELLGGLLGHLIERNRLRRNNDERFEALSKRERDTLALLGRGMEISDIADELVVSRQTVRSHVRAIMTKFEVNSRLEVIQLMREMEVNGTITPGSWT